MHGTLVFYIARRCGAVAGGHAGAGPRWYQWRAAPFCTAPRSLVDDRLAEPNARADARAAHEDHARLHRAERRDERRRRTPAGDPAADAGIGWLHARAGPHTRTACEVRQRPTEMLGFQAEADQWYAAIRNNLTPDQQTKFDALAKPMVFRPMGGGPRQ